MMNNTHVGQFHDNKTPLQWTRKISRSWLSVLALLLLLHQQQVLMQHTSGSRRQAVFVSAAGLDPRRNLQLLRPFATVPKVRHEQRQRRRQDRRCSTKSTRWMVVMMKGGTIEDTANVTDQDKGVVDVSSASNTTVNATTAETTTTTQTQKRSVTSMILSQLQLETTASKILHGLLLVQKIGVQFGPTILTIMSLVTSYNNDSWGRDVRSIIGGDIEQKTSGISFLTMYLLSLLGSSCGFSTFLYFITVGFGTGVALPLSTALIVYMQETSLPILTVVHSVLTILWGVRLATFLLLREYVMWPELHRKIVELQSRMSIPFVSKLLCWFVYSFFYVSLVSSCWSRLIQAAAVAAASSTVSLESPPLPVHWNSQWGPIGYVGIFLQVIGLSLETIADWQKTSFKKGSRHSWCNVGVWSWSTHPHYLGDGMFWVGTYLSHGFYSLSTSALATVGLGFVLTVLKSAARSLATKQKEKYGKKIDFCDFQRSHNVFGPKGSLRRKEDMTKIMTTDDDTGTSNGQHDQQNLSSPAVNEAEYSRI
mmetsp:Transcript_25818/g.61156  ORF Transcript_25818/g.61156 Transcript_25818/m.61156 type:complete len:537 (-) Transcript_25818:159-1769(-)